MCKPPSFLAQTTSFGSDKEGRFWYFFILYMLSQDWVAPRDVGSSKAALPMRYSTTRQQTDQPLRAVRALTDEALRSMSTQLERLYSTMGRPSSPPEQLLRALLFQVFYRVRGERLLMEELDYNLLFRWHVGLNMEDRLAPDDVGSLRVVQEPLR